MDAKENLKIGLLGVIAVTLIIDTFFMDGSTTTATPITNTASQVTNASTKITPDLNTPNPITDPAAAQQPTGPTTTIQYAKEVHDFGTIKQDSENEHVFKFTNTGTEPLLITNARGSCGCTVPQYPTEPIAPGASSEIKVVYKPGKQKGAQTKYVTVTANTEPTQTKLQITANVEEVPQ